MIAGEEIDEGLQGIERHPAAVVFDDAGREGPIGKLELEELEMKDKPSKSHWPGWVGKTEWDKPTMRHCPGSVANLSGRSEALAEGEEQADVPIGGGV